MDDGDLGAIEMSNTGHSPVCTTDDFDDEEVMLEAREPFAWVNSHVQRQNRCFVMVLVLMITVAAVYVMGGVSLVQEEALEGDKYDAESGILTDGFASVEEQDLYERQHDDSKYNRDWWAAHGKDNPFGNQNAVEHGNNQVSRARWNTTHPGQPFPGHGGLDKRHPGTLGKKGGKKGGNNALHPGNRPDRPNNGQSGGKNMGLRPGKVNSRPTPHNPGQSSGSSNGHASDRHTQQCDHSAYADWIAATVTIADGVKYEIVERIAHDNQAFVQGLTYADGTLWESNGLYGKSTVRILDPNTAEIIKSVKIPGEVFGEGMTYRKGKLYQITWKSHRGFIYNATTLDLLEEFEFHTTRNEGWGITWDPCEKEFVVTDGSANLHFWDKEKLTEKRTVLVKRMDGSEARELNEIEWYRGKILANVWFQDVLLVIDPITGIVEKEYDFSALFPKSERTQLKCDVFNGISVSSDPEILYVTGKKWDRMFKVRLL